MVEAVAARVVIVDNVHLAADNLGEPNRGAIANAEIPCGPNQRRRVVWHAADAPFGLRFVHQPAVISPHDRGLK